MNKNIVLNKFFLLTLFLLVSKVSLSQEFPSSLDDFLNKNDQDFLSTQSFQGTAIPQINDEIIKLKLKLINDIDKEDTEIEKHYFERTDKKLKLQGYEFLKRKELFDLNKSNKYSSAVQDNYIIGPGDEIILSLQGSENKTIRQRVNRQGQLIFPFTSPISAFGRKFSEIRDEINIRVNQSYLKANAYISLGDLKQISVTITGEVYFPGTYSLNGLATILDAISLAGGIKKTGSLRNILSVYEDKKNSYDIYDILFGKNLNKNINYNLYDGSIIQVPTLKNTVAIDGKVNKPGIYEIRKGTKIKDLIEYSGSIYSLKNSEITLQRVQDSGQEEFTILSNISISAKKRDIIYFNPNSSIPKGNVRLNISDNVINLSRKKYSKLSELIPNIGSLSLNSYTFMSVIKSFDPTSLKISYKGFNLLNVLNGKEDYNIGDNDEIFIFSNDDVKFIQTNSFLEAVRPISKEAKLDQKQNLISCLPLKLVRKKINAKGISHNYNLFSSLEELVIEDTFEPIVENTKLKDIETDDQEDKLSKNNKKLENINLSAPPKRKLKCPEIFNRNPDLLPSILENIVIVRGEIKNPGVYLAPQNYNPEDLINYLNENLDNIIVSEDKRSIDVLSDKITLYGAVRFLVNYEFEKGDTLYDILQDKNLIREDAYPFYSIIERKDSRTGVKSIIPFNLSNILYKNIKTKKDLELQKGDKVKIYSNNEIFEIIKEYKIELLRQEDDKNIGDTGYITNENLGYENDNESESSKFEFSYLTGEKEISFLDETDLVREEKSLYRTDLTARHTINHVFSSMVHVKGSIINSGYYPIADEVKIDDLLNVIGGLNPNIDYKNIEILSPNGINRKTNTVMAGDVITFYDLSENKNNIIIKGNINKTLNFSYYKNFKLSDIISQINFRETSYPYFATILRKDILMADEKIIPFSPIKILRKQNDFELFPGDKIYIYSKNELDSIYKKNIETTINPLINDAFLFSKQLHNLIQNSVVTIEGPINNPGKIFLGSKFNFSEIINISGGLRKNLYSGAASITYPIRTENSIEILEELIDINTEMTKNKSIILGSNIRIYSVDNKLSLGSVSINGEVNQEGNFQILDGDTIFNLLKRSGGLKSAAYLEGMIFTRKEEKIREKKSFDKLRAELDKAIVVALEKQSSNVKIGVDEILALKQLSQEASKFEPIGRVVGNFKNIDILKNTFLRSGDTITIPKRPSSITIVGEIMSPGSILWNENHKIKSYIDDAAGFTDLADTKKIFIIKPNGQSKLLSNLWNKKEDILPGSTIVIPRKVELASILDRISSISSVVYQITLSLAGLDNVLNN